MKLKFPILLMLIGLAFSACQKEVSYEVDPGNTGSSGSGGSGGSGGGGSSSGYYIKGKKDGTAFSFTNNTMAMITSPGGGVNSVALIGLASANGSSLEGLNLSINFTNGTSLGTATYAENDGSMDHVVAGVYNPNSTTIIYSAMLIPTSVKPLKIVVTAKSNTEVSGTFEGAFYKTDTNAGTVSSTEYVLFTEGEFKLPVK